MKKIPMRMCVACKQMFPKKELVRIVRVSDDAAVVDRTGKQNGRGAYLCAKTACLEKAIKIKAFERALGIVLSDEIKETLKQEITDAEQTV